VFLAQKLERGIARTPNIVWGRCRGPAGFSGPRTRGLRPGLTSQPPLRGSFLGGAVFVGAGLCVCHGLAAAAAREFVRPSYPGLAPGLTPPPLRGSFSHVAMFVGRIVFRIRLWILPPPATRLRTLDLSGLLRFRPTLAIGSRRFVLSGLTAAFAATRDRLSCSQLQE